MSNETSAFIDVDVDDVRTSFKKSIYLKPKLDMKMYSGRDFHITHGEPGRSLFEPSCISYDNITGYRRDTKEEVECKDCVYAKGLPQGEGNLPIKCQKRYTIFMDHEDNDKQYALSFSVPVQKVFSEYRKSLLKLELDVDKVITKITRVEPAKGNGYAYTFELVSELDLNVTNEERTIMNGIVANIAASEEKVMSIDDVAQVIELMFQKNGNYIDKNRTKRLAASMSKDGSTIRA